MALRNSFHRVGVVIVDANITHVLAAAVLFAVGTEQVKGFAITFLLGALLSIWATMFVAKTLFEVCERRRWVQQIKMRQWIGHTTIDFMHWFPACATFSVIITVVGIGVAVVRGKGLFDIDFTGGISVQTVFKADEADPIDAHKIRAAIAKYDKEHPKDLPDATVTPVQTGGETRFVIDTSNLDGDMVKKLIQELFGDKLVTSNLKYDVSLEAPKPPPAEKPAEKPSKKTPEKSKETTPPKSTGSAIGPALPKPSGDPVDMSSPKLEPKPTATAPASAPPATTGSAPAAPAPTGTKPVDTKDKKSQSELPPASLVAMDGPGAFLLAQADKGKAKPEIKADAKAEPKPDAKPAAARSDAKIDAKPEVKGDSKPPVKPETKPADKHDAKPAAGDSSDDETASEAPPTAPAVHANLSFTVASSSGSEGTQGARYEKEQVRTMIKKALEAKNVPEKNYTTDLSNDDDTAVSDNWKVTITPVIGAKVPINPEVVSAALAAVQTEVGKQPYFPGVDNMGSAVAKDAQFWACVALVLSWLLIIIYLWIRFQGVAFGVAAVIALVHDVFVMLGAIALSSYLAQIPGVTAITLIEPFKINLTIVAAFLTIIGYSVNDTIIVFDRIREVRGKSPILTRQMVNDATNQTLGRTVLTSFTVLVVVLILYIFGGQAMHGFAFALFIGVLTGTYSSIYVAAPTLLWLLHPTEMGKGPAGGTAVTSTR
jgi:SecD/SecF fusion protein